MKPIEVTIQLHRPKPPVRCKFVMDQPVRLHFPDGSVETVVYRFHRPVVIAGGVEQAVIPLRRPAFTIDTTKLKRGKK